MIDLISSITLSKNGSGKGKDVLGFVFEYFLGQFAAAEGKKGGQFYTPQSIVKLLVEMLEPEPRKVVYDGCCGSGGMFVQSERFIEIHEHRKGEIAIFGQESNPTTYRLAKMNLAIRGIDAHIELGDTLLHDKFPTLKADYILANPPFNVSDYRINNSDKKWKYGIPPTGNANYAWLQHFADKLSTNGIAGIVLSNGSMSSGIATEREIRKNFIESDLVECIVALPSQLFYNTQIPACLWLLSQNKEEGKYRNRTNEVLFIDARETGIMISRTQKELEDNDDISRIAEVYHSWRQKDDKYKDVPGFCRSTNTHEIRKNNYILTPGRYVQHKEVVNNDIPFEEKMNALTATLKTQLEDSSNLELNIIKSLKSLGYEL